MTRLTHGFMLACMVAIPLATAAKTTRAAQAQESPASGVGRPAMVRLPRSRRRTGRA